MSHLLDTCIVSELVARKPDARVVAWVDARDPEDLHLSAVTIGEIAKGVAWMDPSPRKNTLEKWLNGPLQTRFAGRILPLDAALFLTWGGLTGELLRNGTPMPVMDSLIAATARHHRLRIVTRNVDDFRHAGVEIINPWK